MLIVQKNTCCVSRYEFHVCDMFYLHMATYGGRERVVSISPVPQSMQLNRLFWEYDVPNGTDISDISLMLDIYVWLGNPK